MSDAEATEGAPDLLPARMLNEYVYCPRLFYLEWVQGEWADNYFTEDGRVVHRRVDREEGAAPDPEAEEPRPFVARSVLASSPRLGVIARVDVIEGEDGKVTPIDYKRGHPTTTTPSGVNDPERVQVCAQALVLRENGYKVDRGEIYFAETRQRVPVELDDELVRQTEEAIRGALATAATETLPPPLVDSPKCNACSLVAICLPDEVNALHRRDDESESASPRRLLPARDDAVPLYVQRQGVKLGVSGDVLEMTEKGEKVAEAKLEHTSHVAVFGGVQVSTQAVRRLLQSDRPLAFFSAGGWFYGWAHGLGNRNIELRIAQFRAAQDTARSLELARGFVAAKIANQRTIVRRNRDEPAPDLDKLTELRDGAGRAGSIAELLGIEGTAARIYFAAFPSLLKTNLGELTLEGRNRRPPRDPVNAILSFCYALLTKDWTLACALVGLDPFLGFYHRPRFGRPSLALDLMEEFRPIIADSVVLGVVNTGALDGDSFVRRGIGVALKDHARRALIAAYERRMDELVTHPVFGYRISYRRTLEVQARLLGRHLMGEIPDYPSFRTR